MAGIPCTGIGGLFYVICALVLPLRSLLRTDPAPPAPTSLRAALGLALLAAGVSAGIWFTGVLLAFVLPAAVVAAGPEGAGGAGAAVPVNVIRVGSLLLGLATLSAILGAVEVARVALLRPAPAVAQGGTAPLA